MNKPTLIESSTGREVSLTEWREILEANKQKQSDLKSKVK